MNTDTSQRNAHHAKCICTACSTKNQLHAHITEKGMHCQQSSKYANILQAQFTGGPE